MEKEASIYQRTVTGDYIVPIKDACINNGNYSESYPIGFKIFDDAMKVDENDNGGVRDGDLVVITGRSGEGKTTFAQNIVLNFNRLAISSLFFSYEVVIDNLYGKFKQMGYMDDGVIFAPKKNITGNLNWIKTKIKEAKERFMIKAIFIDHIDFLSPANEKSNDQLRMVLHNITQQLKTMAIDENVIIFLLAHVRKVENRPIKMEDIAESGGIYKLADYVFSIERGFEEEDGRELAINEGVVSLLKNRLTGKQPYMKFRMINNIVEPI